MTLLAEEALESPEAKVFTSVARGLSSDLSPAELLHLAVRLARRLLEAERATILLLDGDRLVPEVSVARDVDEELFARFRDMPPITLNASPQARAVLEAGEVVVIERASESSLVPAQWRDAFGLHSLAIAPLVLEGKPCGILVVEGSALRLPERPSSMRALRSIAAMTAMAVGGSRRQRSALAYRSELAAVRDTCAALRSLPDLAGVADAGLDALLRLCGTETGQLVLLHPDGPHTEVRRGGSGLDLSAPVAQLDGAQHAGPRARCLHRQHGLVVHQVEVAVLAHDRPLGYFLVDGGDGCPSPERLLVADLLADGVAQALERVASERQRSTGNRIRQALRVGSGTSHLPTAAAQVAALLRESTGIDLVEVVVARADLAAAVGAGRPTGATAQVHARWRRAVGEARTVQVGDVSVAPLLHGRQVLGALRLRRTGPAPWGVDSALLTRLVAEQVTALLLEVERRRAGTETELHLAELRDWKSRLGDLLPRMRVHRAQLGPRDRELAQTLDAFLAALQRPGATELVPLAKALSTLVRAGAPARTDVQVKVTGTATPLPLATDLLVRRLAEELAQALEERSRASQLLVELRYAEDSVSLLARDDGLPLSQRSAAATRLFERLRTLARRCDELGGSLQVRNLTPLGVLVTATLPLPDATTPAHEESHP